MINSTKKVDLTLPIFTKNGEKGAYGPQKYQTDFGCSLDHITLGLGLE